MVWVAAQWAVGVAVAVCPASIALPRVAAAATVTAARRVVLFKGFHENGLTFYTNYEGRKAQDLAQDGRVALVFWWDKLERQVRVEGRVQKLPQAMSEDYFHSRPRASQLGAVASRQSRVVATREELDQRLDAVTREFEGKPVPLPAYWGGYKVTPELFEFWQGRRDRLHDRLVYRRQDGGWRVERLEP